MVMKYSELKVGDWFKIIRNNDNNVYVKMEYGFHLVVNPKIAYRPLFATTKVFKMEKQGDF